MLLNDFCSLKQIQHQDHNITATVSFNKEHSIFGGHFEGFPVVPGVCMMQIVKEIMELQLNKPLKLSNASQMKFLTVINPNENAEVSASIQYAENGNDDYNIEGKLFLGETTFFKIKAVLVNGQ